MATCNHTSVVPLLAKSFTLVVRRPNTCLVTRRVIPAISRRGVKARSIIGNRAETHEDGDSRLTCGLRIARYAEAARIQLHRQQMANPLGRK